MLRPSASLLRRVGCTARACASDVRRRASTGRHRTAAQRPRTTSLAAQPHAAQPHAASLHTTKLHTTELHTAQPDHGGLLASLRNDAKSLAAMCDAFEGSAELQRRAQVVLTGLHDCSVRNGTVYVTGIGKSGYVGRRIAASLASIGVKAQFVSATEWLHGDLGLLRSSDAVLALSHSGNTEEVTQLLHALQQREVPVFALVGSNLRSPAQSASTLASHPAVHAMLLPTGAEFMSKLPSRSIVGQEAAGTALVAALAELRGVDLPRFVFNHPGGAIGAAGVEGDTQHE